jgi:hypothetical protein
MYAVQPLLADNEYQTIQHNRTIRIHAKRFPIEVPKITKSQNLNKNPDSA